MATGAGGGSTADVVVVVVGGEVGSGAAVSAVAQADSSPIATTAKPKSARMPSPFGARYPEDACTWWNVVSVIQP
jgi:hypothetical protein